MLERRATGKTVVLVSTTLFRPDRSQNAETSLLLGAHLNRAVLVLPRIDWMYSHQRTRGVTFSQRNRVSFKTVVAVD